MGYNILLYGATGFSGRLIAAEGNVMNMSSAQSGGDFRMILAARDLKNLRVLAKKHSMPFRCFGSFIQDARFAGRSLLRRPAFATAAVLTMALGVGVNTAIFSVVEAVLLSPREYQKLLDKIDQLQRQAQSGKPETPSTCRNRSRRVW